MVVRKSDGLWAALIALPYRQPVAVQWAAADVRDERSASKKESTIRAGSPRPPHAHMVEKRKATETSTLSHLHHRVKQERSLPIGTISNGRYARCRPPAGPPLVYGGGGRHLHGSDTPKCGQIHSRPRLPEEWWGEGS